MSIDDFIFYIFGDINYLVSYIGDKSEIVLPNNCNGGEYEIYENAFYGCENLISIVIPKAVKAIGKNAFYECENLASATFENLTGWKIVGSDTSWDMFEEYISDASLAARYLNGTSGTFRNATWIHKSVEE